MKHHHHTRSGSAALAVIAIVLSACAGGSGSGPPTESNSAAQVRSYPNRQWERLPIGNVMRTLPSGTYQLTPSSHADDPVARLTVPDGWHASEGPNRVWGGDAYVGVLVLEVQAVAARPCDGLAGMDKVQPGTGPLVRALTDIPGFVVVDPPEKVSGFGYPATHVRMRATTSISDCKGDFYLFDTAANGLIGALSDDAVMDLWVVDVDGFPMFVQATSLPGSPRTGIREMRAVVDSVEFRFPEQS